VEPFQVGTESLATRSAPRDAGRGRRKGRDIVYWTVAAALWPPLRLWYRWHFRGVENLPAKGGVIVASNHISYLDPLAIGYLCLKRRRAARFLTKHELFEKKGLIGAILGWFLRATAQIPVRRGTAEAAASLEAAEDAIRRGECVVVFPEGTISYETFEPARPHTGVARLAQATGAPVVPVGIWGAHRAFTKKRKPDLRPRIDIAVYCGEPFELDPEIDPRSGAEAVMDRIRELVDRAMLEYPVEPNPGEEWWLPPRYRADIRVSAGGNTTADG
jgi:1-acyl-sn-glycerol-3-phosphate acyltransferase